MKACVSAFLLWTALLSAFVGAVTSVQADDVPSDLSGQAGPCPIILTQIPAEASSLASADWSDDALGGELPIGARIVLHDCGEGVESAKVLTPDFAAAGRPDVSFDGTHILFVARRNTGEKNAVWEMRLADGQVRQVVAPPAGCDSAIYLSTLYNQYTEYPVRQIAYGAPAATGGPNQFFACRTDGSNVQQITFAPQGVSDAHILSDGRLLFSMALPDSIDTARTEVRDSSTLPGAAVPRESPAFNRALFTINVDGTDVFPFAGIGDPPARRGRPREGSDGWVYFIESDATTLHPPLPSGERGGSGGSVVAVRRTGSLHSRRIITSDRDGRFQSVSPLEDDRLLVSYRPGADRLHSSYGLYVLDPNSGKLTGPIVDEPTRHEVDPIAVHPRPVPRGRSSVVNSNSAVGQLYCLNISLSDNTGGSRPSDGLVTGVRIFSANAKDKVLGTASVESDGSFYLEIPARTPIRFETVDDRGDVVRTMRSWMWVMPAERRGCIGCHEDRELAPPNRHVLALRKPPQSIGVGDSPDPPQEGGKP